MNRRMFVLGVLTAVLMRTENVLAARIRDCGDPAENRVIWADPFDNYTQWAFDNSAFWTGGPPYPSKGPDQDLPNCNTPNPSGHTRQTSPAPDQMARAQWVSNNCPTITSPGGVNVAPAFFDAIYGGGGARPTSGPPYTACYGQGQTSTTLWMSARASYAWGTGGSYDSMGQFSHSLVSRIQAIDPSKNAVNGSDAHPLMIAFELSDGGNASNNRSVYDNSYIELSLGDETAPTDYIWRGHPEIPYPAAECCPQGPYPVVCQQVRETNDESGTDQAVDVVYLDQNCPPLSSKVWKSMAFGFLAITDKAPCGCPWGDGFDSHIPTANHFAVFDGNVWRQINEGRYQGLVGVSETTGLPCPPESANMQVGGISNKFTLNGGNNKVYLKIITDYVLIYVAALGPNPDKFWGAAVPRVYKGPFDTIRWGVGKGCELDPNTGQCKSGGTPTQCLTYSKAIGSGGVQGYWRTEMDGVSIISDETSTAQDVLVYNTTDAACCMPNGTCSIQDPLACSLAGGTPGGANSTCATSVCCAHGTYVWADRDGDGDVDLNDYARFQACYTGPGGGVPSGCQCFNRDGSSPADIDADDYNEFTDCATGENVPWSMSLTPNCVP